MNESGAAESGTLPLLRAALEDDCDAASDAAALALGRLAHPDALPRLVGIMANLETSSRRAESILVLTYYLSPEIYSTVEDYLLGGSKISPQSRTSAASLYRSAIRTVRWLSTQQGLGRITDLGVAEARSVLTELDALGQATQADSAWLGPIQELLEDLKQGPSD